MQFTQKFTTAFKSLSVCAAFAFLGFVCLECKPVTAQESPAVSGVLLAPKAFRVAAAKVHPLLVRVETFGGVSAGKAKVGGASTGFIIDSEGHILTSTFNFIERPQVITVVYGDGKRRIAKLLGRDSTRQIAMLKVKVDPEKEKEVPLPKIVPRDELKVGQWAISVGVGFGDKRPALSVGIISATSRILGKAVQTDANTSPANYGGPLLDIEGRVIGICTPLTPQSEDAADGVGWYDSGIAFAIPLDGLEEVLNRLKKSEDITSPFLGVQLADASDTDADDATKLKGGAEIMGVAKKSPADKAKLAKGDVVTSCNGKPVGGEFELRRAIHQYLPGEEIELAVVRGNEELTIKVTLGERSAEEAPAEEAPAEEAPAEEAPEDDTEKEKPETE